MSRPFLVFAVILSVYTLTSTLAAGLVTAAWRVGVVNRGSPRAAARANRILMLRLLPASTALSVTLGLLLPAYLAFEPPASFEQVGPWLAGLAGCGALLVAGALVTGARAIVATRRLERSWLGAADPLIVDPPIVVPAFAIESCAPLVALVGVWRPTLVTALSVVEACGPEELASIVRHEMGHLHAHDNLKRLLVACAPDLLHLSSVHGEMAAAWHHAAEDAADDQATLGNARARLELAGLLVKVARLAPQRLWTVAAVSPFVDADELDRRVRRLLQDDPPPQRSAWSTAVTGLTVVMGAVAALCLSSPPILRMLHSGVEALVAAGR